MPEEKCFRISMKEVGFRLRSVRLRNEYLWQNGIQFIIIYFNYNIGLINKNGSPLQNIN
jgi:hypothetical protein